MNTNTRSLALPDAGKYHAVHHPCTIQGVTPPHQYHAVHHDTAIELSRRTSTMQFITTVIARHPAASTRFFFFFIAIRFTLVALLFLLSPSCVVIAQRSGLPVQALLSPPHYDSSLSFSSRERLSPFLSPLIAPPTKVSRHIRTALFINN